MKKLKKIIYIIIICFFIIYAYLMFFSTYGVKYDLTDCVRYFDSEGRYRLMLVGNVYFFVDEEKEFNQKANIIQYYYEDGIFYGVSLIKNENLYFVFNIETGEIKESLDVDSLSKEEKTILSSEKMIQLDIPNQYENYFRKFIPLKYRKK